MRRRFQSITPHGATEQFAVATDGTAWWRFVTDGTWTPWLAVTPLPDAPDEGPDAQ
jgi:hypothetical protein